MSALAQLYARATWCTLVLGRLVAVLACCQGLCKQLCSCIATSPVAAGIITAAVVAVASLILLFNVCLARLFTVPGAVLLNAGLSWVLLRLAVRVIAFPGSILVWRRSTEAMWRVEMAKQWARQLEQLLGFLRMATGRMQGSTPCTSFESALTGCALVQGLARNLRAQQRDKVRFTQEQARMRLLVTGVETWLNEAKVCDRRSDKVQTEMQVPLVEWIQRMSESIVPVPFNFAVANAPLVRESEAGAGACVERLEQLMVLFEGLHNPADGCCSTTRRFMRVPTVGSLHQMRAELQVRYSGRHCWVRTTAGRKIDGMFIVCQGSEGGIPGSEGSPKEAGLNKEDIPLKDVMVEAGLLGPVIVWCNPNAGYYETMAYEPHWLNFYLSQGCSVFLFNYGGFGRSQGHTSPSTVVADGNAVIEFLKRRGFTEIGVHGRSIGGIVACSLAKAHPDVVKILVADRTFSSLARVAKYSFGEWAVKALGLSATWADNLQPFLQARCHKVMICDPKDATVPDISSLRTGVAAEVMQQVPPADRLMIFEDRIQRFVEAWMFLDMLTAVFERDDAGLEVHQCPSCQAKRPARQPVVGKPQVDPEARPEACEEDTQHLVGSAASWPRGEARRCTVDIRWLEEHVEVVQTIMAPHIEGIRLALNILSGLNASGVTLEDAMSCGGLEDACEGLRCFLNNLQVWGSLGGQCELPGPPGSDGDIELFLTGRGNHFETRELALRLGRVLQTINPDKVASHHRQLSRAQVAQVRRLFRQQLNTVRRAHESSLRDDSSPAAALCTAVLAQLREIEGLLTVLYRFFKCADTAGVSPPPADLIPGLSTDATASEDSEECRDPAATRPLRPIIDRNLTGYVMTIDCGHNGVFSEHENQHLALHLRAARFGKYGLSSDGKDLRGCSPQASL